MNENDRTIAQKEFLDDIRASTTPLEMINLLTKLFRNELLSSQYTTLLLTIMRLNKLYPQRLMRLLHNKTPFAHEIGTAQSFTHDVGIITLPHDTGHIANSAYIKNSTEEKSTNERVLAEVAQTIYDYFCIVNKHSDNGLSF